MQHGWHASLLSFKLQENQSGPRNPLLQIFFDVAIEGESAGRIVVELFDDVKVRPATSGSSFQMAEAG